MRAGSLCVLLVQRALPPFHGVWALPGGFVGADEPLAAAAARKLAKKTGVERFESHLEQLASYGDPQRDPRMRVVSVAHLAIAPNLPEPSAGTDALSAKYWPLVELGIGEPDHEAPVLAFDHATILRDAIERVRGKLEHASLATAFCEPPFTIADLRHVYEAVWGTSVDPSNFQRKVLATPGFIEPTDETGDPGPAGGHRPRLYRAGGAALLHPAMLRHAP